MRRSPFISLLALLLAAPAFSATVDEVLARLEQSEKEMRSVRFDFVQSLQLSVTKQAMESRGAASFRRPDRFRVELKGNEPQTFISDGTTLWVHMPQRKQAMKQSMAGWAKTAGFPEGLTPFRMDTAEMRQRYTFTVDNPGAETPILRLKPKSADAEYSMRLWVDMATGLPTKTELLSPSATVTTVISNAAINPSLGDAVFKFSPPAGTDVMSLPFGEQ